MNLSPAVPAIGVACPLFGPTTSGVRLGKYPTGRISEFSGACPRGAPLAIDRGKKR